jgi:hypothetical protein
MRFAMSINPRVYDNGHRCGMISKPSDRVDNCLGFAIDPESLGAIASSAAGPLSSRSAPNVLTFTPSGDAS